jgi:methionyl aminopeptidase
MQPKTPQEVEAIRNSGQILNTIRDEVAHAAKPGVSTQELADMTREKLKAHGGEPAFAGYMGFPDVVCISVNDQVVHGVPGSYVLGEGDLVSIDLGVLYQGMITDSAVTVVSGDQRPAGKVRTLLKATEESLYAGIDQVKPGARIGDIGNSVQRRLLRDNLSIVETLVGHGVGHEVHEQPEIPNFGMAGTGSMLKEGMTIAIEPMATLGSKTVRTESDGLTISTSDHSLSAHFEHTVLVTGDGFEILT